MAGILSLSPNPASDQIDLTLGVPANSIFYSVEIIYILGKKVYSAKWRESTQESLIERKNLSINTCGFENGVYRIIFRTEEHMSFKKLMIIR
jgi:hypothetical protein